MLLLSSLAAVSSFGLGASSVSMAVAAATSASAAARRPQFRQPSGARFRGRQGCRTTTQRLSPRQGHRGNLLQHLLDFCQIGAFDALLLFGVYKQNVRRKGSHRVRLVQGVAQIGFVGNRHLVARLLGGQLLERGLAGFARAAPVRAETHHAAVAVVGSSQKGADGLRRVQLDQSGHIVVVVWGCVVVSLYIM